MVLRLALALPAALVVATCAWAQPRLEVPLSGDWECLRVAALQYPPPADGWQPFQVPGCLQGRSYERAWFRRSFAIPREAAGKRLLLHFGGVKYNSTVYLNGQAVGGHFGGYDPFDVEVTAVARPGEDNLLELACHDWTGVFADNATDLSDLGGRPVEVREIPRDEILAPIGGLWDQFGPWDRVTLRAVPAVSLADVFIQPSVRRHALKVEYKLQNTTAADVTVQLGAAVDDQGAEALRLPATTVAVPAGATVAATLEAPWDHPRCWSPEDPYLYHLVSSLRSGDELLDQTRTRFGFREFWVQGPRFYLNGSRVNLLATSWWPEMFVSRDYVVSRMRAIKAAHCVIFRTHTQPWPELWYETADEVGLMMIPEGAVWNDDGAYRVNDPAFWDNYATHLRALVDREKNRPSVVMYSLENEFYGGRINNDTPNKAQLAHLGELMHQWDPTRPIYYESDGDPGGVADVIGIHYPHEYPDHTDWPNTANWMDQPKDMSGWAFLDNAKEWLWTRQKPVYVGEFLWIPSSSPAWHTVFFGDDAYLDYEGYRNAAKGVSWRMAIEAYRRYEVGGISPWTMVEGGALDEATNPMYAAQQAAMRPLAAFVREYDHNVYAGARVERTADVYNDTLAPRALELRWALRDADQALVSGGESLTLEPGERREVRFAFDAPAAAARRDLPLRVTLSEAGREVYTQDYPVSVFPALRLDPPGAANVGLFDPVGRTRQALSAQGWEPVAVDDLGAIPAGLDALIIGAGALSGLSAREPVIGAEASEAPSLLEFAAAGVRVLVLEQTQYPTGMLPASLAEGHRSTMTFPQIADSPLLRDLKPEDLKWWRPDNYLTDAEPARPDRGSARAIVVSGSAAGLAHAPLLEALVGRGAILMCQLKIIERLGQEPAAGLLLRNALDYLQQPAPAPARTALFCPNPTTSAYLKQLGLECVDITQDPEGADWKQFDLFIATGPLLGLQRCFTPLFELIGRGGSALLHNLDPEEFEGADTLLGTGLRLQPQVCAVTRRPGADPLSDGFANEDLYWLDPQPAAISWATAARDSTMTTAVFTRSLAGKRVTRYPNTQFTVEGTYTSNGPEGAILPHGQATATVPVSVATDGPVIIGVIAGGSPAAGIWPSGGVSVDGRAVGSFACNGGEPQTYTVSAELAAGEHLVTVRFTNDTQTPTEDRNLLVQAVLVAPDKPSPGVAMLTEPPAVAVLHRLGGRIVVDNLAWETNTRNAGAAARYVTGLLTGLGARFAGPRGAVYEATSFEPDPGMPWFRRAAAEVYMGSSGALTRPVTCARDGEYEISLTGRGTPVAGIYPIVRVEIDETAVGEVELAGQGNQTYTLPAHIARGPHQLRLVFTNDEWAPPEDRNLTLTRVSIAPAPEPAGDQPGD